ncbi:NAD(P)H-dependent oxidoreductase [Alphaproteobacteria bacterium]|nr:NAD(P)H-dependent oxidoreductase [Alphaproteobacteria bacterium]
MKKKLKFSIIYGSTRKKRLGIRFVNFLQNQILKNGHTPYIIDPLEKKLPLLDKRFDDFSSKSVPKNISSIQKDLSKSDAFIIVSAEYNHMPPPALINLLNYFYKEYDRKPSSICTYSVGDLAGIRVQSPLRAMMAQFGSPPIKHGMFQPKLLNNFDIKGVPIDSRDAEKRFLLFFKELIWYTEALKIKRNEK